MTRKPRLLFVVTEDWYFVSHRLDLACAARDAGFEVGIATRVNSSKERIQLESLQLFPLRRLLRSSLSPWTELSAVAELTALYRQWRPEITHHIAIKPVIYGGLAARRALVPCVVSALAGLGYVFASNSVRARLLRPAIVTACRSALRHPNSRLIVQNPEDKAVVLKQRLVSESRVKIIRGSGVDITAFLPSEEPRGDITFVLAARMLWNKGISEFVAAACMLRERGIKARFILVGESDGENPAAISAAQLCQWQRQGNVEWLGHRADMQDIFRSAHVVCLPTYYGEGLPKVLLEAAACARPLIASDVPGCREIAVHNETALLVPTRNAVALADAMQTLAGDAELRQRLGHRAREIVCSSFTVEQVNAQTIEIYSELLETCKRS